MEESRAAGAKLEHNHIINKRVMEGNMVKKRTKPTKTDTHTLARSYSGHSLEREMEMGAKEQRDNKYELKCKKSKAGRHQDR